MASLQNSSFTVTKHTWLRDSSLAKVNFLACKQETQVGWMGLSVRNV